MDAQRGNWSSNTGLILAATGSAIGLGNRAEDLEATSEKLAKGVFGTRLGCQGGGELDLGLLSRLWQHGSHLRKPFGCDPQRTGDPSRSALCDQILEKPLPVARDLGLGEEA